MKALVISGSRNPNGQTARAANAFLQGIVDGGGTGEILFLPSMNIERCRQCEDSGWGTCIKDGTCAIHDDFAAVVDKINEADVVAFASPVYYSDLSESLRAFLDRLRRIRWMHVSQGEVDSKHVVCMYVAGGSGNGSVECMASMVRAVKFAGFEVMEQIPTQRQNLDEKADVLQALGKRISGCV